MSEKLDLFWDSMKKDESLRASAKNNSLKDFEYPFYAKQIVIHFLLNLFDDSCSSDFEIETMRYE